MLRQAFSFLQSNRFFVFIFSVVLFFFLCATSTYSNIIRVNAANVNSWAGLSSVPTSADTIIVSNGKTLYILAAETTAVCGTLIIGDDISNTAGHFSMDLKARLVVSGNIVIGGNTTGVSDIQMSSTSRLTCATVDVVNDPNAAISWTSYDAAGYIEFTSTPLPSQSSPGFNYLKNVILNAPGYSFAFAQDAQYQGSLTIKGGTLYMFGHTISTVTSLSVQNSSAVYTSASDPFPMTSSFGSATTVVYDGTGQVVSPHTYGKLDLNGSGTATCTRVGVATSLTLSGNATVNGSVTYNSGAWLYYSRNSSMNSGDELPVVMNVNVAVASAFGITLSRSTTFNDTLVLSGGRLFTSASDTAYLGAGSLLNETFGNELRGIVSATRTVLQSVPESFSGICTLLDNTTALGVTTVVRTTGTAISANGNQSIKQFYDVVPANNSGLHASMEFEAFIALWNGRTSPFTMFRSTDGGASWNDIGGSGSGEDENIWSTTGIAKFGRLTLSDLTHPLPIELATLSASVMSVNGVTLNWSTVSESRSLGFYVERRGEGEKWFVTVSKLVAGAGSSLETRDYTFTDNTVSAGTYIYRLKMVDLDGSFAYSTEIKVVAGALGVNDEKPLRFALGQNYPNPFNPTTNISFEIPDGDVITLAVYDDLGRMVQSLVNSQFREAGSYSHSFNASNLSSGTYFYRLTARNSGFTEMKRMVILK